MGKTTYRDWIPDGEEQGAQGKVYQDFVPTPTEQPPIVVPKKDAPVAPIAPISLEPIIYYCDKCDFVTKHKVALSGHSRKHK